MGDIIQFIPKPKRSGIKIGQPQPVTHRDKVLFGKILKDVIKLSESGAFELMDMVHSIAEGGCATGDELADAEMVRKINKYLAEPDAT